MDPSRAAILLRNIGAVFLFIVFGLRGLSISLTQDAAAAIQVRPAEEIENLPDPLPLYFGEDEREVLPVLRDYTISQDGQRVTFQAGLVSTDDTNELIRSGWYQMPLSGGAIMPAEEPVEDIRPFVLRRDQLFLLVSDGVSMATGSPRGTLVVRTALSPDRSAMAFAAIQRNGSWGLFVLYTDEQLEWLGDEEQINELVWSPDSEQLAYIAPREGVSQIIRVFRNGGEHAQLTFDDSIKQDLAWSGDGSSIAYIAYREPLPQALGRTYPTEIYLIPVSGGEPKQLTETGSSKNLLQWVNNGTEIAFSSFSEQHRWPWVSHLNIFNTETGSQRRVYPPLDIEEFTCPMNIPRGQERPLIIRLSNSGLLPATAQLVLRAGAEPHSITEDRQANAIRVEPVDLPPGETQNVEWPVEGAPGLVSYYSVLIDQGEFFPLAAAACSTRNTYLGLPNLSFLSTILPLIIPGMLLLIPWLRHQKKRWLWFAWLALPLLIAAMVLFEANMVPG
jgi:hypothetical protein